MKKLVILGAGSAGTMMANHLNKKLKKTEWSITIIDEYESHYYQPGFLFIPFGIYKEKDVVRSKRDFIPKGVEFILKRIKTIATETNSITLESGEILAYDILIIATGTKIAPSETAGVDEGWYKDIFDFYTLEGSKALYERLKTWQGGKLVVHITELPIKCPVAPLEFSFLADSWLRKKGLREKTEIIYVTPLSGAFTKPTSSKALGYLLEEKGIKLVTDFGVMQVDAQKKKLISYDEIEVDYDLLVTIPTNMGDRLIEESGLGDDLNYVATDKYTLQSKAAPNVFVIGDATNIPASKAGSVAHFEAEILTENILLFIEGKPLKPDFDGHANCFIESGNGKALLIDFNYDVEPVFGTFPFPIIGPMKLLRESRLNHIGKMVFKWIYWNMLLRAIPIPLITAKMSRMGKKIK